MALKCAAAAAAALDAGGRSVAQFLLGVGQVMALAIDHQFRIVDEGHAVFRSEGLGAGADKIDVRAKIQDEAGGMNGIAEALDTGDAAGTQGGAIHQ